MSVTYPAPNITRHIVNSIQLPQALTSFIDARRLAILLAFLFLLRKQVSHAALSIPAAVLAVNYEYLLEVRDGVSTLRYSVLGLMVPWLGTFIYRVVRRRRWVHNMPGVPHNYFFGHLPTLAAETMNFPPDAHSQLMMNSLCEKYDLRKHGLFYLDTYPIQSEPMIVVIDPEVAAQVTQGKNSWAKHPMINADYGRAVGPRGVFLQEDEVWKDLRTMFNPGFSQANLLSMVPMLVKEGEIFASRLSKLAAGDGFIKSMDSLVAALTVDVIGQALFGINWHTQTLASPSTLVASIVEASRLAKPLTNISPERFNLPRILRYRYHDFVGNAEISKTLMEKWSQIVAAPEKAQNSHFIFDIAMNRYLERGGKLDGSMSNDFLEVMRDNVKTFIFAGHDTTSAVITYTFYELSRNPEVLKELREEHDTVLGSDPKKAGKALIDNPQLANALPYTTAVIRETMRLYLPASSIRAPPKGAHLLGRDGRSYPTEGCNIWLANFPLMQDASLFPSPTTFIPSRFIPSKSPFPPIPKSTYRPFEKGARDCIGQELAMLESRVALALTVRRFGFKEAYEELDKRLGRGKQVEWESCRNFGGRAYQILFTTAKPKDGLPMWVSERGLEKEGEPKSL